VAFNLGVVWELGSTWVHFSRVARASDKNIHNYFSTLYFVYGTTLHHSQNNSITWQQYHISYETREARASGPCSQRALNMKAGIQHTAIACLRTMLVARRSMQYRDYAWNRKITLQALVTSSKNGMASYLRRRGKEQGIQHHESELLRKPNFDKLIHEFACKKAHKVRLQFE